MRSILYSLLLVNIMFISFQGSAQEKFSPRKFLNERIELKVPDDFEPRSDIPRQDSLIILTDREQKVNISIRFSIQQLDSSKIAELGQIIKSRWDKEPVLWLNDGVTTVNEKLAGFYKFIHTKDKVFYCTLFTDLDGRLLTVTVTFPVNMVSDWEDLAEEIVYSLKIH